MSNLDQDKTLIDRTKYRLIEFGESADQAWKLARVVRLTQDKALQTDQEWKEFMAVWED